MNVQQEYSRYMTRVQEIISGLKRNLITKNEAIALLMEAYASWQLDVEDWYFDKKSLVSEEVL